MPALLNTAVLLERPQVHQVIRRAGQSQLKQVQRMQASPSQFPQEAVL